MKNIEIIEGKMRVNFRINEDRTVELVDFSGISNSEDLPHLEQGMSSVPRLHQVIAMQITGESATDMHAYKHNSGSESTRFLYENHSVDENNYGRLLTIKMVSDKGLHVDYSMQFFTNKQIVRISATIKNNGYEDIGVDFVSSFFYGGISKNGNGKYYDKTDIFVPYNSWSNEAQWKKFDLSELGLSRMPVCGYNLPDKGNNRFHYGNVGSWSSCEHLPMGMSVNKETNEIYYFQIEHSGSWQVEYGSDVGQNAYIALMGPDDESMWWKNLKPGMEFTTVPVAFGVCVGVESDAIGELTEYRRTIRRPNNDVEQCNIVFNDYMNCLMGDPTEEKEKQIIDLAAELGCEYYCMDCGWYDKGNWWDRVGEWKESKERFPNGLKTVCDYARSKGLKMGLWLEIEVMGIACELSKKLPDDWFVLNHGKRRIDNKRYLLDFRNPDVRKYCMDVIDRLINEYGVEFFKIDYNVTTGPGSDINTDSCGDAMLEHYRCLYQWINEIYKKYPYLVIENCGSGAQRMDYGILSLHSLQSTSDQTDYVSNAFIATNVATAVTPEQAGMWVYPYVDEEEHVILNMVNGLLLRPYISGLVWNISEPNFNLMKEGISVYKEIRSNIPKMVPIWPLGFNSVKSEILVYGLKDNKKAYLSVYGVDSKEIVIDLNSLNNDVNEVKVIYPKKENCIYKVKEKKLHVLMPSEKCARLFEITF